MKTIIEILEIASWVLSGMGIALTLLGLLFVGWPIMTIGMAMIYRWSRINQDA